MRNGPKCEKIAKNLEEATSDLEIEGQGHKTIAFVALPIYTHIPNLKGLTKIFFKLSRQKGNLCGGGVTILNPKYPRLSSGDTMKQKIHEKPVHSNSNSTFIALNLYLLTDSKTHKAKNQRS